MAINIQKKKKIPRQHHNLMNDVNELNTFNIFVKGNESEFIKSLDPAVYLQKMLNCTAYETSKIQFVGNSTG